MSSQIGGRGIYGRRYELTGRD